MAGTPSVRLTEQPAGVASGATDEGRGSLGEVARLFLRLGFTAFGGPAAHIAMLRHEVVTRRRWLSDQEFLDLLGATNLIPGPNSTEMAIHIGARQAGWAGLIVAGVCFIMPAALIVLALAWAYVQFGTTPQADAIRYGIKPVIIAIVVQALWGLGRSAVKNLFLGAVGAAVLALYLLGINELALLFGSGIVLLLIHLVRQGRLGASAAALIIPVTGIPSAAPFVAAAPVSLGQLFLVFLKIGATLYGSGYVLLAFLHGDFVARLGWLTDRQLLDAVAVGQFTPGPLFTTATFVGYLVAGLPGAALATLGIFLPSFVFVAVTHPLVPRLRSSPWAAGFLDGVNVAAVGLMAAVTFQLGRAAIVDPLTAGLAVAALVLLLRFKVNSAWLVLGGGALGLTAQLALNYVK
jgi:chromate transporter